MIKIGGVQIKTPKRFEVTMSDLDDRNASRRSADGTFTRDRIAVKREISMEFGPLSPADASQILEAIEPLFFDVEYPDPRAGAVITKTFYTQKRPVPVMLIKNNEVLWQGLKVTLTEK